MADELKVGSRALVKDKNLEGTVRFIGATSFAPGKWIGIELDDAKGKNNGLIQGKTYFQCPDNHGLMVRQNQLQLLPDVKSSTHHTSRIPTTHSGIPTPSSKRPSSAGKKSSPQSQLPQPKQGKNTSGGKPGPSPQVARKLLAPEKVSPGSLSSSSSSTEGVGKSEEAPLPALPALVVAGEAPVSDEVADLGQRLAILQSKRAEDKARIKELEKFKAHYLQMTEYKQRWSESQSDLQQQLKAAKKDSRESMLAKERAEEEMRDLSDTVEMATLDKEMAEERCEGLQAEVEALKEKVEELTIDLEIIKQEISDGGVEGAAANAECKQLDQQNKRLKEALLRLRDLSAQDKMENQRVLKDLEKTSTELNEVRERNEKLIQEVQEADEIIDELKEQVDAALGAEEMVEKLTDTNLELDEKLEKLNETVSDLEALRDLSEEQEELRMEVEHELREELDMNLNSVRQTERKLEATQETIVDQQLTIEKFRDLVHNLNADLAEYHSKGERSGEGVVGGDTQSQAAVMSLNVQLKSAIKTQSRTIDFELRKLEAMQASEHINHLLSFMPVSFLVSGGDYDALLVLMMLPRMTFKAELVINQLKQQHKLDDALGSLSTINPSTADVLVFVCTLIYKLTNLNMLVNHTNRILKECDVQLYRQMGGIRDDLNIHEKALDILIELMRKEQLDESVPLHGIDKAISHFESLLEKRLHQERESVMGRSAHLLDQMQMMSIGSDVITLQLLRLRGLAPDNSEFVAQMKELDSFNNDLRQSSKKVRRKVPAVESQRILLYNNNVAEVLSKMLHRQLLLTKGFKALHLRASQRAHSLAEGEKLTGGELEEFINQVVTCGTLQDIGSEVTSQLPKEMLRSAMSLSASAIEKFLSELSEGVYDSPQPKGKLDAPVTVRARAVKAELTDIEGLGFKLEERQQDILQLKKNLKMKAQELSECNVKISLLEKKVESIDSEIARHVGIEKKETEKIQQELVNQEKQFQQTIAILQGDIENLENERIQLEKKLDQGSRKSVLSAEIKIGSKLRTIGGQGSPYGTSPYQSPIGSPYGGRRRVVDEVETGGVIGVSMDQNPLLLSRVESLHKALGFSINENFRLKVQIAKAQLNSLTPLKVPGQLLVKQRAQSSEGVEPEGQSEGSESIKNQTDHEKTVVKRTASLIEDLKRMCLSQVIPLKKPHPQEDPPVKHTSPREQLTNRIAGIFEMQRRANQLKDDVGRLLASEYTGGEVTTSLTSFPTPQFTKVLNEVTHPSSLTARLLLPPTQAQCHGAGSCGKVVLSPVQFQALHMAVIT